MKKDKDVSGNSKYVTDFLSGNGIWFYSIYENGNDSPIQISSILVMERNSFTS